MSDDDKEDIRKANLSAQDAQKALLAAIQRRKQQAAGTVSFRQLPAAKGATPSTLPIPDAMATPVAGSLAPPKPARLPPARKEEPAKPAPPKKKKRRKGEPEPGPIDQLKEKFDALPPTTRTAIIAGSIGLFLLILSQLMGGGAERTTADF